MPPFDQSIPTLILWAVLGYLFGSIPFGLVITRMLGLGDLREIGSGNIGATNVLRTGNKPAALATLLLDAGKGAIAVLTARAVIGEDAAQIAGLMALTGHCFPVWLEFRGGKGVATFLGLILALSWPVGLACCLTWAVVAALGRISSLAALAAAASVTLWVLLLTDGAMLVLGLVLTALVFSRHRENIARLREGTEPRIGSRG
ncbi:acyl-phosphate glycerol-3-phosphate acyltransferase [Salinihabitans flavidus]|uniref:Glycerol-3-phosphate acyltransferase n=1 Tax=Salinihabitans flavidus TaxID=569882 RepID=A0A1H8S8S5_9RHOB|nr:glycerol-3-phosphate 1-O-acyltransferase PlsY [Salinihabitans flavidus]SEO74995.1 acyl-phosphate glycerol-3-phosphate acyltransferase [Salinihabitans flavidus]